MNVPRTERQSARVLLLDEAGRVLLFRVVDPQEDKPPVWITPGGGLEPGENLAAAATRELREETGLVVEPEMLGVPVAVCRGEWAFRGLPLYSIDWHFGLRTRNFDPDDSGWTDIEREVHCDWRWWTCDDLDDADEIVLPVGMAGVVRALHAGHWPTAPIELPWLSV